MNSTLERIKKIQDLLDDKDYIQGGGKLPRWRRTLHFWILVAKSFQRNRGPVRAAALAYTTVLSLIPVLALVVSISTGFLQNDQGNTVNNLLDKFVTYVAPQLNLIQSDAESGAMNREAVVQKIQSYIEAVNSGALGLTAGLALAFIAVMVLSNVESTFNDIWGVTRGRTWSARVIQYWAGITLGPIFIVTAVALTSVGAAKEKTANGTVAPTNALPLMTNIVSSNVMVTDIVDTNARTTIATVTNIAVSTNVVVVKPKPAKLGMLEKIQIFFQDSVLGPLLSFVVLSVFLSLLYRLMPATKVHWSAAAVGGVVGGGLLQLNNLLNILWLSRVVTYSKIYGSLGAVPIFLLGLYFSWMIVLLGAQVAYAFQNRQAYLHEKQMETINQRGREFVALRLMAHIAHEFFMGKKPPTRLQMSKSLGIPSQLASHVLNALAGSKLLVEVSGDETGYAPGRPIDKITMEDILTALQVGRGNELSTADDFARIVLREHYDRIVLAEMHAAGEVNLQSLVAKMAPEQSTSDREIPRAKAAA